ncbi:cytochrome c oxidase assembly protein [Litchfieldia alkalitelluris]|uniref:cytochrome c oxidase assembly protein n=1 Tax=Litchfieldia alkalitelluris TaxID=304268 RepID=UPI0009987CBC|nr:cytochrome c oxidase assembly protein [Litchfieldia alkalitelluris]
MLLELLSNFSFHTQWNAGVLLMVLLSIVFYLFLLPTPSNHPKVKSVLFIFGLFLIFFTVGSPLNLLGRIIFRGHIAQMLILIVIVAPLLILGFKSTIVSKAVTYQKLKKFLTFIKKPQITIVVFHVLFIGYHIPAVFNYVRISYFLNYFYLLLLFLAALLLWTPLIPIIKELDFLSVKQKVRYCLWNVVFFSPLALWFIFSEQILYSIYIDPDLIRLSLEVCLPPGEPIESIPEEFFDYLLPFPPLREQQLGGWLLLIGQGLVFGSVGLWMRKKVKES